MMKLAIGMALGVALAFGCGVEEEASDGGGGECVDDCGEGGSAGGPVSVSQCEAEIGWSCAADNETFPSQCWEQRATDPIYFNSGSAICNGMEGELTLRTPCSGEPVLRCRLERPEQCTWIAYYDPGADLQELAGKCRSNGGVPES